MTITINVPAKAEILKRSIPVKVAKDGESWSEKQLGDYAKKPGVYEVSSDSRIFEVIEKAGGLTGKADTGAINQAELVKDGQKIVISRKGDNRNVSGSNIADTPSRSTGASHNGTAQGKININSADVNELQKIHGVGPATAEKIIKFRSSNGNFRVIEDLKKVNGIGNKTFEKIKDYITV